jgi:iron complex outermembrane receptor protein
MKTYAVLTSEQHGARIKGIELSYEQPFGHTGFGFTSNVTHARIRVDDGRGASFSCLVGQYPAAHHSVRQLTVPSSLRRYDGGVE